MTWYSIGYNGAWHLRFCTFGMYLLPESSVQVSAVFHASCLINRTWGCLQISISATYI